jgi:hypothetical protein
MGVPHRRLEVDTRKGRAFCLAHWHYKRGHDRHRARIARRHQARRAPFLYSLRVWEGRDRSLAVACLPVAATE